jgi:hypothetical protein
MTNTIKKTRKKYSRLIDESNSSKKDKEKIATTDEATVNNHIRRIRNALDSIVQQVEETDTTTKGEGE